jgi:hypothetical protein
MPIGQLASRDTGFCFLTRFLLIVSMVSSSASMCPSARADPPLPPAEVSTDEDHLLPQVTVETRRQLERRVNDFVTKITKVPFSLQDSLPLWHDPLCFAVAGLPTEQGLYALGRLGEIARTTGLGVSRPGCRYNFIVIFSAEPDKLLNRAFKLNPHSFKTEGGMTQLKQFISPPRPLAVRAWHNFRATTRAGEPIQLDAACGSFLVQGIQVPTSCQYNSSRIERFDVYTFSLALVVIDTSYPREFKLGQLIDYAALAGLTELPANLDLEDAPSILRLLNESSEVAPSGLTPWDLAFLHALYHSDQGNITQRSEIAVQMFHEISR